MTKMTMVQKRQEMARAKKEELGKNRRTNAARIPVGKSTWRILPSWRGQDEVDIAHPFGQHFVKDATGATQAVHICMWHTYGQLCPICSSLTNAIKNSNDETQKLLEQSKASSRFLVNALNMSGTSESDPLKPVVLELPPGVYDMFLTLVDQYAEPSDDEEEGIDFLSLTDGYDIVIERTGSGLQTKYNVTAARKPRKVAASVLEGLTNLDDFVRQEHEATQQKALGVIDMVSTGRLPAPAKSKQDDDAFDDDDALDAEFEQVVAEKKSAGKSANKQVKDDLDDLDDLLGDLDDLDL